MSQAPYVVVSGSQCEWIASLLSVGLPVGESQMSQRFGFFL